MEKSELEKLIAQYEATGRKVKRYPQTKEIALNGFYPVSIAEAVELMEVTLEIEAGL